MDVIILPVKQLLLMEQVTLAQAGNFYQGLNKLSDDDWDGIRNMIKSSNDADKAKRSV